MLMKADLMTITKSNRFIQARYELTLTENRLLLLTLGRFNPMDEIPQRTYEFTVQEFCEHFQEVDAKSAYHQIEQALISLQKRIIVAEETPKYRTLINILSEQTYFYEEGRYIITFHEKLMPLISNLKKGFFTSYALIQISALSSMHAMRIFELLMQFKGVGKRNILLSDFRDWLMIENKYSLFADLRKWVLEPAIKEINAKTDFLVSYEPKRRGRSYHCIDFIIQEKPKKLKEKCKRLTKKQASMFSWKIMEYCEKNKPNDVLESKELTKRLETLAPQETWQSEKIREIIESDLTKQKYFPLYENVLKAVGYVEF